MIFMPEAGTSWRKRSAAFTPLQHPKGRRAELCWHLASLIIEAG
jgi:hypothetical protein